MKKSLFFTLLIVFSYNVLVAQETRIHVDKAGTLIANFTEEEANSITHLTITGRINAVDFKHLRNGFEKLEILDISNADIRTYTGKEGTFPDKFYVYPSNFVPAYAFSSLVDGEAKGKLSLRKVILSEKIRNIEDAAFKGCNNLTICEIRKKTAPNLLPDGLPEGITAIFVPVGSKDNYRFKDRWEKLVVIEGEPVSVNLQVGALETLKDAILKVGHQPKDINFLVVEGKLDNDDFRLIRDYMPNLVSVDISNASATAIPNFTFSQKKYMLNIRLPKSLKTIGQRVFSGCERLSGTIVLPPGITSIDYGAFMGCEDLQQVVVTGDNLTTLGDNLFGEEKSKLVYK